MEKVVLASNNLITRLIFSFILVWSIVIIAGNFFKVTQSNAVGYGNILWLITGAIMFATCMGYFTGYLRMLFPALIADSDGIRTENTGWRQSASWCEIKRIELGKRYIKIQYTKTSSYDTYKLPALFQLNDMDDFYDFIEEECKTRNIDVTYTGHSQNKLIKSFTA